MKDRAKKVDGTSRIHTRLNPKLEQMRTGNCPELILTSHFQRVLFLCLALMSLALVRPQTAWAGITGSGSSYTLDCSDGLVSTLNLYSTTTITVTIQNCAYWLASGSGISPTGNAYNGGATTTYTVDPGAAGQVNGYNAGQSPAGAQAVIYFAPNNAPTASNVAISGIAQVGVQLSGSYTYFDFENDPEGTSTFRWMSDSNSSGSTMTAISGATSETYIPVAGDQGKYLFFCVTPVASSGTSPGSEVCSSATSAVLPAANPSGTPSPIPSLSGWGIIMLSGLLGFGAIFALRRRRRNPFDSTPL